MNEKTYEAILPRVRSALLGLAVADALGVPVEFCSRRELELDPVLDMRGFGTYGMPAGSWSDDTTMNLCAMEALSGGSADYDAVMQNFLAWYKDGEFTPTGKLFDIGGTCAEAICRYSRGTPATACGCRHEGSNGNGSLMRIMPFALYAAYRAEGGERRRIIEQGSSLTHAHPRSILACLIYSDILIALLESPSVATVRECLASLGEKYGQEAEACHFSALFAPDFAKTPRHKIASGGYVCHTLTAALWCILNSTTYAEGALLAVNLGEDTDTTAAVCGCLLGIIYGEAAIPAAWRRALLREDFLTAACERFAAALAR